MKVLSLCVVVVMTLVGMASAQNLFTGAIDANFEVVGTNGKLTVVDAPFEAMDFVTGSPDAPSYWIDNTAGTATKDNYSLLWYEKPDTSVSTYWYKSFLPNSQYRMSAMIKGTGGAKAKIRVISTSGGTGIYNGPQVTPGAEWQPYSFIFTTSTNAATLASGRFDLMFTIPAGGQLWYDTLSLELVPEPITITLLGLGGLLISRKRRAA